MTRLWRQILAWWHCTCCDNLDECRLLFLPYEPEFYCDIHIGCLTCPIHQPFQRLDDDATRYVVEDGAYR